MPPVYQELLQHLEHVSAEINTAIQEGFYVMMGVPTIEYESVMECDETGSIVGSEIEITSVRLNYEIQKLDPKRIKRVDHRDAVSKQRNPDYQPPGGVS